jgi:hypothetical protein
MRRALLPPLRRLVFAAGICAAGMCAAGMLVAPGPAAAQPGGGPAATEAAPSPAAPPPRPQGRVTHQPDLPGPWRDAVVAFAACSGVLIAPDVVLTAGHCAPAAMRQVRPVGRHTHDCDGLRQQSALQQLPWEDPDRWYPVVAPAVVHFGPDRRRPRFSREVAAYALPRCADLLLLKLRFQIPLYVARALPVLTSAPLGGAGAAAPELRHAGFGGGVRRGTGPVDIVGLNGCAILGLGPGRLSGRALVPGDSGAPLLVAGEELRADGTREEMVAGIAYAVGIADAPTCGMPALRRVAGVSSWTPTARGALPGTEATPLGDWLRRMVPQADHR